MFSLWIFLCTFQEETILYKQIHQGRKLIESFSAVLQIANNLHVVCIVSSGIMKPDDATNLKD